MTPTQIARRSDALYADGTCGMTRRVLCDMVAQRESDIEDARAENAKLRKELEAAKHDLQVFSANLARLGAENAKLLELVRDTVETLGPPALHVDNMECGTIYAAHISRLEQRMRELGIEVDE